jgi:tRNA wybutosine-synthesizing protein 3
MSWTTYRAARLASYKKALEEGKVDAPAIRLLGKINANPGLVTLSSCSGRIDLLVYDIDRGKKESSHYAKWHEPASHEDFEMKLNAYTGKPTLWFKCEPFILHVAARDVGMADAFVKKMRANGVRRGGIQAIGKQRVAIEVSGSSYMSFPVEPMEGEWNEVLDIANRMMKKNLELIGRLEKVEW